MTEQPPKQDLLTMVETLQQTHKTMDQILGFIATTLEELTESGDHEHRLDYEDAMESATAVTMNIETLIAEFRRIHTPAPETSGP